MALAGPAFAAPPDEAQRKNTARGLADYANQLASSGNYEGAITAFKQADQIYHAPTLVFALAKVNAKARHLLAARDGFKQIVDEALPPDAPEEFRAAQRSAKQEMAAVITSIPTLEVRVRGTSPAGGVQIAVDDRAVGPGEPTDVDPGKHVVKITGAGDPRVRAVDLAEKAHEVVEVDLDQASSSAPSIVPGAALLGVAGLGLVIGTVAGAVTLHQAASIKSGCSNGTCPASDMSKVSSANGVAAVSTTGFVIAGASAIVGTVLLVRATQARPSVSASFGPGTLFLRGVF